MISLCLDFAAAEDIFCDVNVNFTVFISMCHSQNHSGPPQLFIRLREQWRHRYEVSR